MKKETEYYGMSELARICGVSPQSIWELCELGKLTKKYGNVKNDKLCKAHIKKHTKDKTC